MHDLRSTIAHIIEHKEQLAGINEATTQQYVILPILRTLGWNDTSLASMEIIPEYQVESRRADYALHIKQDQNPVVLIECKRWDQPIGKNEEQICFYAYSGNVPLAIITDGKLWRFYLSRWEATSLSDRIFCETDIEDREAAISNLEKYLLKSNVASGEAELNAEIALEEKGKTGTPEPSPIDSKMDDTDDVIGNKLIDAEVPVVGERTVTQVKDLMSREIREHYESKYSEERCSAFYKGVTDFLNLIKEKDWKLHPEFTQTYCGFWLRNEASQKGTLVYGIMLNYTHPRFMVKITEEDAEKMKNQYGCEIATYHDHWQAAYYIIPADIKELFPVFEFTYNKHSGN